MRKRFFAIALALLCKCAIWAQEVKVKSFELDPTDLTAQHENVKDANGDMCALIKVQILDDKVKFEGDIIKQAEKSPNEYYVYVIDGTQRLKLSASNAMPTEVEFSQYGIDEIKGGLTYILKMEVPEVAPGATFEVGMPNVDITVDGKAYKTDATGGLDLPLSNGTHSFVVSKAGYKTYQGSFDIDKIPVIQQVTLQRGDGLADKGLLAISYPLNATFVIIPVNGAADPVKQKVMTGEQIALNGDYQVRFEKKKYKSQTITVTVKPGETVKKAFKNVALEADDRSMANDYAKAFKDYKKMADKGDDLAQYKLGCFYFEGKGITANPLMAKVFWERSANQGNLDACRKLVEMENTVSAKKLWLQRMADNGDADAMVELAGLSTGTDRMLWLKKACGLNSARAYYEMGELYYEGIGGEQNYTRAKRYFDIAASRDYVPAKERVCDYMYLGLNNVEQNKTAAVEGYLKLGSKLSDDGKYKVGMYYYEEYEKNNSNSFLMLSFAKKYFEALDPALKGVHFTAKAQDVFLRLAQSENQNDAVLYYRFCESVGVKSAEVYNALGTAYRMGRAVNADPVQAYQYYKKSSDMGNKNGMCWLGYCYEKGIGVNKDIEEAARLYQRAMNLGSTTAAGYLGTMYALGVAGLPKDRNKAVALWTKAANDGNVSSVRNLIKHYQMKKNTTQVQYWTDKLNQIQVGK